VRQFAVRDRTGRIVAYLDLAWPDLGLFIELDGQHHRGQPVYDSSRETLVVARTGWLCGRFTWFEVAEYPKATAHRLAELATQARRRPVAS
jgi:very-short-patch-repair endonuclease